MTRFEEVLAVHADHLHALSNRADTLVRLDRGEDALAAYERILTLRPDHVATLNKCGGLNVRLGRIEAAIVCYERALAVEPARAELHINKGKAFRAANRFAEALACFDAAAQAEPGRVEAHWNAGLVRLRLGHFKAGWQDYEWRWRKADWAGLERNFAAPFGSARSRSKVKPSCCMPSKAWAIPFNLSAMRRFSPAAGRGSLWSAKRN